MFLRALRESIPPFRFGIAVKGGIDLGGYALYADSFDSANPEFSSQGLCDASKRRAGADVAAPRGLIHSAATVGRAIVLGRLATEPDGQDYLGANGSMGDLAWVISGATGIARTPG